MKSNAHKPCASMGVFIYVIHCLWQIGLTNGDESILWPSLDK